jgi:hypothetical protein
VWIGDRITILVQVASWLSLVGMALEAACRKARRR